MNKNEPTKTGQKPSPETPPETTSQPASEMPRIHVIPGRNGYPRKDAKWGRLTCAGYVTKPIMLKGYGGTLYNSGESTITAIKLTCECNESFEFPIEKWPGCKVLKSCPQCSTKNTRKLNTGKSGKFMDREEPCSMQSYYLPNRWRVAIEDMRDRTEIPLAPGLELSIRELYYHVWRSLPKDQRDEIISRNELYSALEKLRLRKSQRLEPDQTDADPEPGRWY